MPVQHNTEQVLLVCLKKPDAFCPAIGGHSRSEGLTMKRFLEKLKAVVKSPTTQFATGLILLVSGGAEVVLDFMTAEHSFRLGVHHGVALFGLIQMLGSLPELVDGLGRTFEVIEKRREK